MIDPDAAPIGHRAPYRKIDPRYPGRKKIITGLELAQSGGRAPDPAIYRFSPMQDAWILKED